MINIKDELAEIPLRCTALIYNELRKLGRKERQQVADIYEERLSIIAELRIAEHLPPTTRQRLWHGNRHCEALALQVLGLT